MKLEQKFIYVMWLLTGLWLAALLYVITMWP